ncbi:MAG: chromosome segregation protein [Solirubrobacteraceae bacterium]|nr:chromosome segregation protein [Solirubrobacteraceae bacterium]
MHLRSLTLKGFKSFPDRTKLEFGPGVSVVVGPNGSGKSNVTDAVLWAMGEQSPLAVRGQSMRDVIFGGGRGVQARSAAEVEIVIDNSDGAVDVPMGEISIFRRLDRSGEGEYRLNGARCRLVDVLEVLSDTGLGKEMHSVVSQGRVETIVTSKPRERRLLIEEAAGLGKHRKRRRRAQLKLERTQDNLDRALDVEREARSRLRPLKRQAEAAELHERLERQTVEARWELVRDLARARRAALAEAEAAAAGARAAREETQEELTGVAARRQAAEQALAQRTEQREAFSARVYAARSAAERIELRLERTTGAADDLRERIARRTRELVALQAESGEADAAPADPGGERIAELEAELERLHAGHEAELERELAALQQARVVAAAAVETQRGETAKRASALAAADTVADDARKARREAELAAEKARRESATIGAELAACNQFLRTRAGAAGPAGTANSLADRLEVQPGYERAIAAALGGLLRAALVDEVRHGAALLDEAGTDGGRALIQGDLAPGAARATHPPAPGARHLGEVISGEEYALAVASRLLADAWLVEEIERLPPGFMGIAVTREGRVWHGRRRELRQAPEGGEERVLAERNRREALIASSEQAVRGEQSAIALREGAEQTVVTADAAREEADRALRDAARALATVEEEARRADWIIEQRRAAPVAGAGAVRRALIEGELGAERRVAEHAARQRAERAQRIVRLRRRLDADSALVPLAERLAGALAGAGAVIAERVAGLEAELHADRAAGEDLAAQLRACATEEAELQRRLRERFDAVTGAEVRAQQARDQAAETEHELSELAGRLGLAAEPASEALEPEQAEALRTRIERLRRRREQLGPVNPLAKDEYDEALAHVTELEDQRTDLETALRELRALIKETDRQIHETFEQTFEAAARNFEELAGQLFPGGRGRLRLVKEDSGIKGFAGAATPAQDSAEGTAHAADEAAEAVADAQVSSEREEDLLGVEIEITPAGKSMKRLTLLSGGEKSLTAIAFLFAVFLARPCPFYILDEVEAALDDPNITRFLELLRRYADRAQFIVVTHQKRTMEAADTLYGVSMGDDGVSKVISRRLPREEPVEPAAGAA